MATEIERKFLLDEPPDQLQGRSGRRIEQGYVTAGESIEVRLPPGSARRSPATGATRTRALR